MQSHLPPDDILMSRHQPHCRAYQRRGDFARVLKRLVWSCVLQEKGQLLENVFADPKGFGIAPNSGGKYRYEMPGFRSGEADVS